MQCYTTEGVTINLSNVGNGLDLRGDIILKGKSAAKPAALTMSGTYLQVTLWTR